MVEGNRFRIALLAPLLLAAGCATRAGGGPLALAPVVAPARGSQILVEMNGGLIGGPVGASLDAADKQEALEAEYRALEYSPSGQSVSWRSTGDGVHGSVVAGQPYEVGSQNCRQYMQTVFVGGRPRIARGAACRNADGSWTPLT